MDLNFFANISAGMSSMLSSENMPAPSDWLAVLPEIFLILSGVLLVLLGAMLRKTSRIFSVLSVSLMLFCFIFSFVFLGLDINSSAFMEMLGAFDAPMLVILCCGLLTAIMGARYLSKNPALNRGEFYGILFFASASLIMFARAEHLMLSFVALEASAICFYALIAWSRAGVQGLEASIKYLILSGASGAFFLLGVALIYGAGLAQGADILPQADFLYFANFINTPGSLLFISGLIFVFCGIFFKLSAFPFQFWAPDVYQGAPTPVSAFMAAASKGAALIVMFKILMILPYDVRFLRILGFMACAGILIGSMGGINEKNVKRLLGYSGIVNAGYLLVFLAASYLAVHGAEGDYDFAANTLIFYLAAYMLGVYGFMFVQNFFGRENDSNCRIENYRGMWRATPLSAASLTVSLASLAGMPPTAGFFAKLAVLILALGAGLYWLAGVLILGSAVSVYYYFKLMRASFEEDEKSCGFEDAAASGPVLVSLSILTLSLGVICFAALFVA